MVGFHDVQKGGHATESDLDALIFNRIALTIFIRWSFKLLRWIKNLY
jgi:hypothetical protein